eukprot:s586_g19.t1
MWLQPLRPKFTSIGIHPVEPAETTATEPTLELLSWVNGAPHFPEALLQKFAQDSAAHAEVEGMKQTLQQEFPSAATSGAQGGQRTTARARAVGRPDFSIDGGAQPLDTTRLVDLQHVAESAFSVERTSYKFLGVVLALSDEEGDRPAVIPKAKAKAKAKGKAQAKAVVKPTEAGVAKAKAVVKPSEPKPKKGALKKPAAAKSSMKRPASSMAAADGESDQGPPGVGVGGYKYRDQEKCKEIAARASEILHIPPFFCSMFSVFVEVMMLESGDEAEEVEVGAGGADDLEGAEEEVMEDDALPEMMPLRTRKMSNECRARCLLEEIKLAVTVTVRSTEACGKAAHQWLEKLYNT